jgi:hypothetical protein
MDVSYQLKEIGLFFTENGFVTVLEDGADSLVPSVEVDGIPREEFAAMPPPLIAEEGARGSP